MQTARAFDPEPLHLAESAARRLLLAQALEEGDPQGRLVGLVEREQADRDALATTGDPAQGQPLDEGRYLLDRADRLIGLLRHRQPRLAALAEPPAWRSWLLVLLPLAALVLGAAIDRIDNPRQVNLLSPPLLAFLAWNLVVYVLLAGWALRPRPARTTPPPWTRWGLPSGGPRGEVALRFQQGWWRTAGAVEGQRWRSLLHAGAAAWGVGVALAIVLGGVVREYRVGWESTLLDLPQVHAFLRVLFAPVVALLPVEPFSQAELARLHFASGSPVVREDARRWVGLYVALLGLVVVLPRVVLALYASVRARLMASHLTVDLGAPYFAQVLGRVRPVRLVLALVPPADGAPMPLEMPLRQLADSPPPRSARERWLLLRTERGDRLEAIAWSGPAQGAEVPEAGRWWDRWRGAALAPAGERRPDLLVTGAREGGLPEDLAAQGRPVLVVAQGGSEEALRSSLRAWAVATDVLPAQSLPTWREDERLFIALRKLAPPWQAPGLERLAQAWRDRAERRYAEAMRLLADELVAAARDAEELPAQPMGVRQLVVRGERASLEEGRRQAQAALLGRARQRRADADLRLRQLHGLEGLPPDAVAAQPLPERFQVAQALHEPQAGLAGAASGAAMGAAVDLITGGLTLGAASALGALLGGGAALVGAAWKNRGTRPDVSLVALADDMLLALAQDAVVRYLAVAHERRVEPAITAWAQRAEEASRPHEEALRAAWARARDEGAADDVAAAVAGVLRQVTDGALHSLHGPVA